MIVDSDILRARVCREGNVIERSVLHLQFSLSNLGVCAQSRSLLDFRESYAWRAWQEERKVWSAAIRFDLVRSVNKILNGLDDARDTPHSLSSLRMRLIPLRRVQLDLEKHLGLSEGEELCTTAVPELAKQRQLDNSSLGELVTLIDICCDDMAELWKDDDVRTKLETYGIQLDEHSRLYASQFTVVIFLVVLTSSAVFWTTYIA